MTTWNYRIIKKVDSDSKPEGAGYYIHEVYYNSRGEIWAVAQEPASPFGETQEEFMRDFENMLKDAKNQPVLDGDNPKFANRDD